MANTEVNFRLCVRRIMFRLPAGVTVSSPKHPHRLLSTQTSYSVGKGVSFSPRWVCGGCVEGVKWLLRDADHSRHPIPS